MSTGTARPRTDDPAFAHLPTAFVCEGCGFRPPAAARVPMRCPAAVPGDDIDHVLARRLDTDHLAFPAGNEPNPFVRYRSLFHASHVASALGWSDARYVALVERLDAAVARVDGRGFAATPLVSADRLAGRLGMSAPVLVKDETRNVSGSHKARHLMGTALELEIAEALERAGAAERTEPARGTTATPTRLAIASCGNAALAAAVVAKAWGRELQVFVPTDADPVVVDRLRRLDALVTVAPRLAGVPGDPTYHLLREAIEHGAVAFTCQGNENGFALEGGETLGYELVSDLMATGRRLDRLFIQVGGGALASSCSRALDDAEALGVLDRQPRIHAVQSSGARPLVRAYDLVVDRLLDRLGLGAVAGLAGKRSPDQRAATAERLREVLTDPSAAGELAWIPRHRAAFMWPWERTPASIAHGILDDETYDWFAVVRAMLRTGGYPVSVSETTLREANRIGRATTGSDVDHTGSAGLAGLLQLRRAGGVEPRRNHRRLVHRGPPHRRAGSPGRHRTPARSVTMRSFIGRDILSLKDFSRDEFARVFQVADDLKPYARDRRNGDLLRDKTLLTAFYQPSTRTRLSTEAAMHRLGGHVLGFSDSKMTRAGDFYQESIKDTFHMLEYYGDVIAIRHFQQGAPAEAARWSSVPVINCGDGWGEHPTQVLTDLYTIRCERGTLDGLTYLLVGDMRMRTMHSILYALSQFDAEAIVVSPPEMSLLPEFKAEIDAMGVAYREAPSVADAIADADIIYMEPVVQADYTQSRVERAGETGLTPAEYCVTRELLRDKARRSSIILHSLPRMDELLPDVDETRHQRYWVEAFNGVALRMALLALILGKAE